MLRQVTIKNFVHFHKYQNLKFQKGPNYITGANSTGKSSIFELVRRCLSSKENLSHSNIPVDENDAYVVCRYELPKELSGEIAKLGIPECSPQNQATPPMNTETLYSSIVVESNKTQANTTRYVYKVVCISCQNGEEVMFAEKKKYDKNERSFEDSARYKSLMVSDPAEIIKYLKQLQLDCTEEEQRTKAVGEILRYLQQLKVDEQLTGDTQCEQILSEITKSFVLTFPMRSIGCIQWDKGITEENWKLQNDPRDVEKRASILYQLINNENIDFEKEREIFSILTSPWIYDIKKEDGIIKVHHEGIVHDLVKTSEGIIEAKQFSLIVAHRKYHTLCLEEPDMGMHPQMIEKMRDLVLRTSENKVIVFTSHNPAMVSNSTLHSTHVCRRIKKQHQVIKVTNDQNFKTLQLSEMKNILFASSVLFVEGNTDKILMSMIFDAVHGCQQRPPSFEKKDISLTALKQVLCGISIIISEGHTQYTNFVNTVEHLQVPHTFLFDRDVIYNAQVAEKPAKRNYVLKRWKYHINQIQTSGASASKKPKIAGGKEKDRRLLKVDTPGKGRSKGENTEYEEYVDTMFEDPRNSTEIVKDIFEKMIYKTSNDLNETRCEKIFKINTKHSNITDELEKKHIFAWNTGEMEDMVCDSILKYNDQSDILNNPEKKLKMMLKLFPEKEKKICLLSRNLDEMQKLSRCLVQTSDELARFFKFLVETNKEQRNV